MSILYRLDGVITRATLAAITTMQNRGDHWTPTYEHFLRTTDNRVIPIGKGLFLSNARTELLLLQQLGINAAQAGGLNGMDFAVFDDKLIEKVSDNYCVTYQMKPPFAGALHDCAGSTMPIGSVGYIPVALRAREAIQRACGQVFTETQRKCQNNDIDPLFNVTERDAQGNLYFVVTLRRYLRTRHDLATQNSVPVEYDYLVYRVDAISGTVSLLETVSDVPYPRNKRSQKQ